MQATLDTEFIAQTLSQYATTKASETQSQIYMELDKRTNNESRAKLQQELADLRGRVEEAAGEQSRKFWLFSTTADG